MRDVLHDLPAKVLGRPIRPHLGGGTVLAARWAHRLSADVDVLLPGRETLIDLLGDDERNLARRSAPSSTAIGGPVEHDNRATSAARGDAPPPCSPGVRPRTLGLR